MGRYLAISFCRYDSARAHGRSLSLVRGYVASGNAARPVVIAWQHRCSACGLLLPGESAGGDRAGRRGPVAEAAARAGRPRRCRAFPADWSGAGYRVLLPVPLWDGSDLDPRTLRPHLRSLDQVVHYRSRVDTHTAGRSRPAAFL